MADKVRLIDANALKEDFLNDWTNYMMESLRGNYHDTIRISNVIERIEDAPTIETEPVKQGTCWVQRGEEYYCSHCGGKAPMDINRKHTVATKFCPHCGYKMGG